MTLRGRAPVMLAVLVLMGCGRSPLGASRSASPLDASPLEMDGVLGTWRAASHVRGSRAGAAAATSSRAYVLGGTTDGIELPAGVWSTGRR